MVHCLSFFYSTVHFSRPLGLSVGRVHGESGSIKTQDVEASRQRIQKEILESGLGPDNVGNADEIAFFPRQRPTRGIKKSKNQHGLLFSFNLLSCIPFFL